MSYLTSYGKMFFVGKENKGKVIQPKSYTSATKGEEKEALELLMKGDYVLVQAAMPRSTFDQV